MRIPRKFWKNKVHDMRHFGEILPRLRTFCFTHFRDNMRNFAKKFAKIFTFFRETFLSLSLQLLIINDIDMK